MIALLLPASYLVVLGVFLVGVLRLRRSSPVADAEAPTVSVVVTARNEEQDLPRCLAALAALDYPPDRLQFVLVNDRSTDRTGPLLDAFAAQHANAVVLHSERLPDNGLEAKARGLAHGMAHAAGEWILITDADAAVPPTWARHLLGEADRDTVMVSGALRVRTAPWWGWFEGALLNFLSGISLGAAGLGRPFICVGPNMGIRRDCYRCAGGLETHPFRIAEDLALFRMAVRAGRIRQYADPETTAELVPVPRPSLLVSQLRRWFGGAIEQHPAYLVGVWLAILWGVGVAVVAYGGWVFLPWRTWSPLFLSTLLADGLLMHVLVRRLGDGAMLRRLLALLPYRAMAVCFLPLSFLVSRRLRWVGSGYTVHYR